MAFSPKIADHLLLFYGLNLPHHPGKWRAMKALEGLAKPTWSTLRLVERQGFQWELNLNELLPRRLYYLGEHERWETRMLARIIHPGWVVTDVGANIGYYSLLFSRWVGPGGSVHAFEPTAGPFDSLVKHCAINRARNVFTYPLALADRAGALPMLLNETNPGGSRLATDVEKGERVKVDTLDDVIDHQGISRLDFIKVDIEGSELRFLLGSARTIREKRPLMLVEYSPACLRRYGLSGPDLRQALEAFDYRLYRINHARLDPFTTDTADDVNLICVPAERDGPP